MTSLEKTIKIVDPKGKVLAELTKILKDVSVDEFKKILVNFSPFRKSLHTNGTIIVYIRSNGGFISTLYIHKI